MDTRRTLIVHAVLHLVLIVGIALAANHLSAATFWRLDVTMDQRHTLSSVSRRTMAKLDKPLIARVFYSDNLGPPYNNHKQALIEILEELRAFSGGRMEIEIASPDTQREHAEEAKKYGIAGIPYRFKQGTRFEAREIFMGVTLLYGDRGMKVDPLAAVETFEYEIIKSVRALSTDIKARRVVGYSVGHDEPDLMRFDPDHPLGALAKDLAGQYQLKSVALGGDDDIPPDVDLMIVNGPMKPLSARAQYQLDQHLMSGKPIVFFVRGMRPDFQSMRAIDVRHDLGGLIGHYGVKVNKDIVFDRDHNEQFDVPIVKDGRMRRVKVDYPLIPTTRSFSTTHPVTAGLTRAMLPFSSSLTLAADLPTGVKGTPLIMTEPDSSRVEGLLYINPDVFRIAAPGEETGSFPVAIAMQGRFTSFFADRAIPAPEGMRPDDPSWQPDPTSKVLDGAPSRLLVVGSADMVANNRVFVINGVNWLLEDTDLLQIRTDLAKNSSFERVEPAQANLIKAGIVGGPLALLLLMAGVVFVLSRRRS